MKANDVTKIRVKASGEYDVVIGKDILDDAGEIVLSALGKAKISVVTDDVVAKLYLGRVKNSLERAGFEVSEFVFPHGEASKNLNTYSEILNFFAEEELTRTDICVALGGGVTGDMAGFAAATYLRGIRYVQIPTTLLSQIDSSVGGKTAVDLPAGKNLVGAFKQPSLVICDVSCLSTLTEEIFREGMGEAAKYALLDGEIYRLLKTPFDMERLVYLCIDYKRRIVEEDEYETGNRKLLNLGHTMAHGIEKLSDYTIPHGTAVAMGLELVLGASFRRGYIDEPTYCDLLSTVRKCAGESKIPYPVSDICRAALSDKKRSGDKITVVCVHGIGDPQTEKINIDELEEYFS